MQPFVYYNADHSFHTSITGGSHPECPTRVMSIMSRLEPLVADKSIHLSTYHANGVPAPQDAVPLRSWTLSDGDTYKTPYTANILAVSRTMIRDAVKDLHTQATHCAFVLCRPPGHHASTAPAGFCHENNVWTAVQALHERGVQRIGIYDWDVHHGDGTQALVKDAQGAAYDSIRFVSTHAYGPGVYPGTGAREQTQRILSIPLSPGARPTTFLRHFDTEVLPFLQHDGLPEIIIISAGYDAHKRDPMKLMNLETETYQYMARKFAELSVPILFLLEGGYNPAALAECVVATLHAFLPRTTIA